MNLGFIEIFLKVFFLVACLEVYDVLEFMASNSVHQKIKIFIFFIDLHFYILLNDFYFL